VRVTDTREETEEECLEREPASWTDRYTEQRGMLKGNGERSGWRGIKMR
jgi:hypothetical protein